MDNDIKKVLKEIFGYDDFISNIQEEAIKEIIKRDKDIIILFPTGAGKSLCYQLPAYMQNSFSIVISPLISLIQDQLLCLEKLKIPATCLNSKKNIKEKKLIKDKLISDCNSFKLLYITPEYALSCDFKIFAHKIKYIPYIIIDEAHCVSKWGYDFRKSYLKLGLLRKLFPSSFFIVLTATATRLIIKDIEQILCIGDYKIFHMNLYRSNIFYDIIYKNEDCYTNLIDFIKLLSRYMRDISGIIYCHKRKTCEYLSTFLSSHSISTLPYHSGIDFKSRNKIQQLWMNNEIYIICATNSFGMGINKNNVRFIIHWDTPIMPEDYIQESGRAGRDQQFSICLLYYSQEKFNKLNLLKKYHFDTKPNINENILEIFQSGSNFMEDYVNNNHQCLHKQLCGYFDQIIQPCQTKCCRCYGNIEKYIKNNFTPISTTFQFNIFDSIKFINQIQQSYIDKKNTKHIKETQQLPTITTNEKENTPSNSMSKSALNIYKSTLSNTKNTDNTIKTKSVKIKRQNKKIIDKNQDIINSKENTKSSQITLYKFFKN